jgi:hypothetical protein
MDIAWMLGHRTGNDDWELRMSMRSFQAHYRADAHLVIIGHVPEWIDPNLVWCLPWPDPHKHCKDANLIQKALRLAMEPELSDPFVLCSDNHLLLRDCEPEDFRLWHMGEIAPRETDGMTSWDKRLVNTGVQLREAGLPSLNFEGHIPYPLRKEWIANALRFNFAVPPGMCVFSTILNGAQQPADHLEEAETRAWLGDPKLEPAEIDRKLAYNHFACLSDGSLANDYLVSRIEALFPEPAPWELDAAG